MEGGHVDESDAEADGTVLRPISRGAVLAAVAAGNFSQLGARFLLSPVVPLVLLDFGTNAGGVGLALTGMWAAYALLQFPSGILADRYGERRLVIVGLTGAAVGAGLVAVAPSLLLWGVAALLLGAGTGLFFSPTTALLSRLFDRHGAALGALTAGGALAGVVYPAIASVVGVRFGWRPAIAVGAVLAVPALVGVALFVPATPPVAPDRRLRAALDRSVVVDLLARPGVVYTTLVAVLAGFSFQAFSSFFPTFLVFYRDLDPGLAGVAFAAAFALSALAQPMAGRLSDAVSRDAAIATSATLAALGLTVLLLVPGWGGLVAGTTTLGIGVSWPGTLQARFVDQFDATERGVGFGLVRSVYMLLAAPSSAIVGLLADAGGWLPAYGVVVAALVCCLGALALNHVLDLEL